jgi:hypothetical protein
MGVPEQIEMEHPANIGGPLHVPVESLAIEFDDADFTSVE